MNTSDIIMLVIIVIVFILIMLINIIIVNSQNTKYKKKYTVENKESKTDSGELTYDNIIYISDCVDKSKKSKNNR